jgi:hypothetical protein
MIDRDATDSWPSTPHGPEDLLELDAGAQHVGG